MLLHYEDTRALPPFWNWGQICEWIFEAYVLCEIHDKKLIRRWDSERELLQLHKYWLTYLVYLPDLESSDFVASQRLTYHQPVKHFPALPHGRHHARTTKYKRLVHKFRHRSTPLCVGTRVCQIQWNNAITSFKVIQGHRFWYQSKAHIGLSLLLVINTNLPPILHRFLQYLRLIIGQIFASESGMSHFNVLAGVIPCQYRNKWYITKN